MSDPRVSIIVVSWEHPEIIDICLRRLTMTEGVPYEVVVVDNGSSPEVVAHLEQHRDEGRITTLVLNPRNGMFSEGNNLGVAASNPASEFVLLLNSDIGVTRSDWLAKIVAWADGTIEITPGVWGLKCREPKPGPYDIVSAGFAWDPAVLPSMVRPEGFCCLIRREWYRGMSLDFPHHFGFEEMVAGAIRDGARCGVLSQYGSYFVHREQGSGTSSEVLCARTPDIPGWFAGLDIVTLDFSFGPDEHSSYWAY